MNDSYSQSYVKGDGNETTFSYLTKRFGSLKPFVLAFIEDQHIAMLIHDIYNQSMAFEYQKGIKETEDIYLSSKTFRIGSYILKPIICLKNAYYHLRRKK